MYVQVENVTVTTVSDGTATAYTGAVNGVLSQIIYAKTDYANGVDFTITADATGETIWTQSDVNASAVVAPRQATHSTVGVATLYAAGGAAVLDKIAVSGKIKIVLAQGGDTKTGAFTFLFV